MNNATSSGIKTADGVISNLPGTLCSMQVIADGTNSATAVLYDNASAASGTVLAKVVVNAGENYEDFTALDGIVVNNGIYLDITTAGTMEVIVHFEKG